LTLEKLAWLHECTHAVTPALCTNIIVGKTKNEGNTFELVLEAMEYNDLTSAYQEIAANGLFITDSGTFTTGNVYTIFYYKLQQNNCVFFERIYLILKLLTFYRKLFQKGLQFFLKCLVAEKFFFLKNLLQKPFTHVRA
jgi:hypothetical protein